MNKNIVGLMGCAAALFAVAGCTPEARQDVGQAGDNLNQAADKSAKGTAEAVDKAAATTADAAKDAAVATKEATKDAVQTTEKAVAKTGEAVADATKDAAQTTEKAVAKTGAAMAKIGDKATLTPKVKNAILVDDSVKIDMLNVDTIAATKMVELRGKAETAAMKTKAESIAKKVLAEDKAGYKLDSKLTVGPK